MTLAPFIFTNEVVLFSSTAGGQSSLSLVAWFSSLSLSSSKSNALSKDRSSLFVSLVKFSDLPDFHAFVTLPFLFLGRALFRGTNHFFVYYNNNLYYRSQMAKHAKSNATPTASGGGCRLQYCLTPHGGSN